MNLIGDAVKIAAKGVVAALPYIVAGTISFCSASAIGCMGCFRKVKGPNCDSSRKEGFERLGGGGYFLDIDPNVLS